MSSQALEDFVNRYLNFAGSCYRHCDKVASFVRLGSEKRHVVGAYVCPEGYVSKAVYFDFEPHVDWFGIFLAGQVGKERVRQRDLRIASRYGWELGDEATEQLLRLAKGIKNPSLKEVYWTIHSRGDEDSKLGTFLCKDRHLGCGKLFTKDKNSNERLCPECRAGLQ